MGRATPPKREGVSIERQEEREREVRCPREKESKGREHHLRGVSAKSGVRARGGECEGNGKMIMTNQ